VVFGMFTITIFEGMMWVAVEVEVEREEDDVIG
jgi:hypothetical protein